MTNDYEVIMKRRWGSGRAVSSVVGSWWSSESKGSEMFWSFYIWKADN